jgi:oligoendopeptidase F
MLASPRTFPRTFVPAVLDASDFSKIEPLFLSLEARHIDSVADLEHWLADIGELASVLGQESAQRYIAMTCHTDDAEIEKRYLHFVEEVQPKCKPYWQKLDELYLASPFRKQLPQPRYHVFDRNTAADVALFRPANIPLQTQETKLEQEYSKICGAMTVHFEGDERTLPQMARFLEETDRQQRQAAWEAVANRRLQHEADFDRIYNEQIVLRNQMARNADCANYVDYIFRVYKRFDYTPHDCAVYLDAVRQTVVPVLRRLNEKRQQVMNLSTLRPWDLGVDPKGRPPLRPFNETRQLNDGVRKILHRIEPELAEQFDLMRERNLLDLESRKGKAPGGYQYTLDEDRLPFIFMNAAGMHDDVETLLHEAGHAFHALAARDEPLLAYRSAPIEFCEVASMSMELMGAHAMDEFYPPAEKDRANRKLLEGIIRLLPWVAQIDAFQHWIYRHPGHTNAQRNDYWLQLDAELGGGIDWNGYENVHRTTWQRQRHLWGSPFYYIEYGIAQLGALQLWSIFRQDRKRAIAGYRRALALGGSRPLPELFAAAGVKFDFGPATVGPLMQQVAEELERIPD